MAIKIMRIENIFYAIGKKLKSLDYSNSEKTAVNILQIEKNRLIAI